MTGKKTRVTVREIEFPSIASMCEHYGITRSRWNDALKRCQNPDEALNRCLEFVPARTKKVIINGREFSSIYEAACCYRLNPCSVYTKMSRNKVSAGEAIEQLVKAKNNLKTQKVKENS